LYLRSAALLLQVLQSRTASTNLDSVLRGRDGNTEDDLVLQSLDGALQLGLELCNEFLFSSQSNDIGSRVASTREVDETSLP